MEIRTIDSFSGEYRPLSNFWPVKVYYDGLTYTTVEHAYQAAKTLDLSSREKICKLPTAGKAKKFWDKNQNPNPTPHWEENKLDIMRDLIQKKFSLDNQILLVKLLVDTDDSKIIEGNRWKDTFWGMVKEGDTWVGENNLGTLLVERRADYLRKKETLQHFVRLYPTYNIDQLAAAMGKDTEYIFLAKMAFGIK